MPHRVNWWHINSIICLTLRCRDCYCCGSPRREGRDSTLLSVSGHVVFGAEGMPIVQANRLIGVVPHCDIAGRPPVNLPLLFVPLLLLSNDSSFMSCGTSRWDVV